MDTRFLRSLIAVVETGSIAGAARREKLTAAALSQRIQALERELDCTLLARGAHTVRPTEACLALLPRARGILRESEALRADVAGEEPTGELRIGAISTALTGLLPATIRDAAARAPRLRLRLVPGSSSALLESLIAGDLDMAILVEPPFALPKTLASTRIRSEPLVYMTRDELPPEAIARHASAHPFIRYEPSSFGGRLVARYMADMGIAPPVLCDLDALEAIALLVAEGLGNALVPAWAGLPGEGVTLLAPPSGTAYARHIVVIEPSLSGRRRAADFIRASLTRAARPAGA
ncbi:LysR substrate-binding domain-containing protein [Ancylobacter amanitiformis]|uniref:DNA-binding transcriptional LysR family regulator n=1 Tax=Ancylobacter amanitiformis TaxID=217069 RepID=A0ABU0LUI8_9HYPH|nr:LysR substrate-binding domain-containing protein [Ancylobacter amanitiformis]MDQ0512278.1 DNA-binding transcriptional LysR family regulator [Ancylobacter amanitiformis]